jgi:hypothetical protein
MIFLKSAHLYWYLLNVVESNLFCGMSRTDFVEAKVFEQRETNAPLEIDKMREISMKVMKTNDSKTISSIPKAKNCLMLMLIGKSFIAGTNQYGDLKTSNCNIFERQIAQVHCSGKIDKILMKLQFAAIF